MLNIFKRLRQLEQEVKDLNRKKCPLEQDLDDKFEALDMLANDGSHRGLAAFIYGRSRTDRAISALTDSLIKKSTKHKK